MPHQEQLVGIAALFGRVVDRPPDGQGVVLKENRKTDLGVDPVVNHAVMHSDRALMPRRRMVWSGWNYVGRPAIDGGDRQLCVTYWMNNLQRLATRRELFVTLNPIHAPRPDSLIRSEIYEHPLFDTAAIGAQPRLWALQGRMNTWYCGAYFGSGFHEDGLQAGLAVAEALGGVRRPWTVPDESGRIHVGSAPQLAPVLETAA